MLRRTSLALVLSGALVVAVAGAGLAARAGDGGYPQRIGFQRPSPPLPERPGALAATMHDNAFGNGRWVGLTAGGEKYDLPPVGPNLLSPDGRLLLTSVGSWDDARLAVHDLVSGEVRVFDDVVQWANNSDLDEGELRLDTGRPVHWSPDGTSVLAWFRTGNGGRAQVLDVATGELTALGRGTPAGFLPSGEAVTATVIRGADTAVEVTTTDVATGTTRRTPLRLATPWRSEERSRSGASISPAGTLLLVQGTARGESVLRMFALADGSEQAARSVRSWDGCGVTWLGDDPVVPTSRPGARGSRTATVTRVGTESARPLVAVHFRMQSSCLQVTPTALAAGPDRALAGTATQLWTWYWVQLLGAGLLGLVALGLALRSWRWRASLRAPSERMRLARQRATGL